MKFDYLVTGGAGFLGRYIIAKLLQKGCTVLCLDVVKPPSPFTCDYMQVDLNSEVLTLDHDFDCVIHAAGLAHVYPRTKTQADAFFRVNLDGTGFLLNALEKSPPDSMVFMSTVAVYGKEEGFLVTEDTACEPRCAYGASKLAAEQAISTWCTRNGVRNTILRLPLVVGPEAPGNLGKMVAAIQSGKYLGIGSGNSRHSMVWLEDVAVILPSLAEKGGVFHLTDGVHPSFLQLEGTIAGCLNKRRPRHIPYPLARAAGLCGDWLEKAIRVSLPINSRVVKKMTNTLTFSDQKARKEFDWRPQSVLEKNPEIL